GDREILIEAESLRHVADPQAYLRRVADDIQPETGSAPSIRLDQPAQHPNRRCLAAAVGAEKAADLACRYGEREAIDDLALAVSLMQVTHIDDAISGHELGEGMGRTSMGSPGLSP